MFSSNVQFPDVIVFACQFLPDDQSLDKSIQHFVVCRCGVCVIYLINVTVVRDIAKC